MDAIDRQQEKPPAAGPGRVFSIAPGAPFLRHLAEALVEGRLVPGFRPKDDPLLLPSATIYLPTRRAARALAAEFIGAMGGRAALLPSIRTLGDGDEDELHLSAGETPAAELENPVGELERRLLLARLVRGWTGALAEQARRYYGDEDIAIPSSAAEAVRLAGDLASLLDAMQTEEIGWDALPDMAGPLLAEGEIEPVMAGRWAEWWNLTLRFLAIVSENWPRLLEEAGRLDPSDRRRRLLDLRTARLGEGRSGGPVIAAGSTGSIPATARLIAAIAGQPNGAVVLPGLDMALDEDVWAMLGRPDREDDSMALCTHPQQGLARLLKAMNVARADVVELAQGRQAERMAAIRQALLPAGFTARWAGFRSHAPAGNGAFDGLAVIEAVSEREEALAIAVALRETLETPGRTAALVTPDRTLARRVAAELRRFGIDIDDTAGTPLASTQAARTARLVARAALGAADPVTLAALAKDPAVSGPADGAGQKLARLFELAVLRGAVTTPRIGALAQAVEAARRDGDPFRPAEVQAMVPADWEGVHALAARLDEACQPLARLHGVRRLQQLAAMTGLLRVAVMRCAAGGEAALEAIPGGAALAGLFDTFPAPEQASFEIEPDEFPDIFDALLEGQTVREQRAHHPRLSIQGPLEARLQHADRVILAGLNEGTWPAVARNDPFLNRPMRAEMGLSLPERRIGQAAHDFQQLSGHEEVIYSRSLKAENAPTVASRWLQRLTVVAGEDGVEAMRQRGRRLVELARAADRPAVRAGRTPRPNPKPPVALRPVRLSVTEIETWIRDPYAIFARHVLGLRPLPPLEREADPLLRGQLYHRILARFVAEGPDGRPEAERLDAIARECFADEDVPPDVAAVWMPRFRAIGRLFLEWEADRAGGVARSLTEISGSTLVGGLELRGRADRIDILADGTLAILDYKTGSNPSVKQARTLSPQLALEARMAELGAFGGLEAGRRTAELAYVRLRAAERLKVDQICEGRDAPTPAELVARAWNQLGELVAAYRREEQGYLSRHAPAREADITGEYDHLARVREWSTGEEETGDA